MLLRSIKSIKNGVTKRRTGNTNYRNSDSRLYCEHNTIRTLLSSCLKAILVHCTLFGDSVALLTSD